MTTKADLLKSLPPGSGYSMRNSKAELEAAVKTARAQPARAPRKARKGPPGGGYS